MLIAQMCAAMALNSSGFMQNNGCTQLLTASSMEIELKQNVDKTEVYVRTYGEKEGNKILYSAVNKQYVEYAGKAYVLNTIYQTQHVRAPIKPIADNIDLTIHDNYCNVVLNWSWSF
jgi:hypothetical protein